MKTINKYVTVSGLNKTKLLILSGLMSGPLFAINIIEQFADDPGSIELYRGAVSVELFRLKESKLIKSTIKLREYRTFGLPTHLLFNITSLGKKYVKVYLKCGDSDGIFHRMNISEIAVLAAMQDNSAMNSSDFPKRPVIKGLKYPTGGPLKSLLYRMQEKGVLSSELRTDLKARGTKPTRCFSITDKGKQYLALSLMIGSMKVV